MNLKAVFFYFWLHLITSRHSGILSIHGVAYTYLYVTNYVELKKQQSAYRDTQKG